MRDIQALAEAKAYRHIQIGKDVATLASQMEHIRFTCPVCGEVFCTEIEALACRDQPFDDGGLTVGTIVVVPCKWTSWYSFEDPWVAFTIPADPSNEDPSRHKPQYVPYYVVTAIHSADRDPHRCIVTLSSLVDGTLCVGWNPANGDGHYPMYRIDGGKHCDPWEGWEKEIGPYLDGCVVPDQVVEEAARLAHIGISTGNLL